MNATGYKVLGYVAWHGGKWYLRRNYARKLSSVSRNVAAGGLVLLIVAGAVAWLVRRS
jgi:hypothetical protein